MVTCQRTPIERKQLWESIMGINVELVICMLDAQFCARCQMSSKSRQLPRKNSRTTIQGTNRGWKNNYEEGLGGSAIAVARSIILYKSLVVDITTIHIGNWGICGR